MPRRVVLHVCGGIQHRISGYAAVSNGGQLCIWLRPGALGRQGACRGAHAELAGDGELFRRSAARRGEDERRRLFSGRAEFRSGSVECCLSHGSCCTQAREGVVRAARRSAWEDGYSTSARADRTTTAGGHGAM